MGVTEILFWFLSVLAVGGAIAVVASKSAVFSVLWLIIVFFAISGHYILMNAQFLAIVNLIVYAGAIMVLFLFVIMLMNLNTDAEPKKKMVVKLAGTIAGGCLMVVIIAAIAKSDSMSNIAQMKGSDVGLIRNLGKTLFNEYVIPFEISSVLFLSAMVGAVVLSKRGA